MHKKYGFDKMPLEELTNKFLQFRWLFLDEELNEIGDAIDDRNAEEIVDGLIDLCVVAIGTLDLFNVDAEYAWNEVLRANLAKKRGVKEGRETSNGWDLNKPEGWVGPDHTGNTGLLKGALETGQKDVDPFEFSKKEEPVQFEGIKCNDVDETCAMKVLDEAKELQARKGDDYQNPASRIKQADHYPRGVATIADMVHQKLTRIYSLLETFEGPGSNPPNFESIEDSAIDAINYLSFLVSYVRGQMDGQDPDRDMFNRIK
jgi:hypothetical protein